MYEKAMRIKLFALGETSLYNRKQFFTWLRFDSKTLDTNLSQNLVKYLRVMNTYL